MDFICNCPYCWFELKINSEKPYFYIHPPNFQFKEKYDLRRIFFWTNLTPPKSEDKIIQCENCRNFFHIELLPSDPLSNESTKKQVVLSCNNYLALEKIIDKSYIFINRILKTNITNPLILNTILVLSMLLIFIILPSIISGSIEILKYDYWLFVTPVLFILLLTSFKRQLKIIHESLNYDVFPILLHENYKKTNHYQIFKNTSINCFFFGQPTKNKLDIVLSPPFLFGLLGCLIGLRFFMFFLPIESTLYEVVAAYPFNSHIYTSVIFNIGYLLFHIPFWFTTGTIVWISLITPNLIAKIAKNIPLQINPLQEIGGTEFFGEILLKSNVSIGILALGVPAYILRNQEIFDPTWLYFNILLMVIFVIVIFFSFFHPLYPIHVKMKQNKLKETNDLINEIDYSKIKNGKISHDEINLNILRIELIKKISLKNEWPFNFPVLVKIILLSLIPLIQLIISIFSLVSFP